VKYQHNGRLAAQIGFLRKFLVVTANEEGEAGFNRKRTQLGEAVDLVYAVAAPSASPVSTACDFMLQSDRCDSIRAPALVSKEVIED